MNYTLAIKDAWQILLRFLKSWVGILLLLTVLLLSLDAYPAARAALIVVFGSLGAFAGYKLTYGHAEANPYNTVRRQWKLSRTAWVSCVATCSLLMSIWLLTQGISTEAGSSVFVGLHLAAANGFFFFAAAYGIGGMLSISDAKLRIKQATFDEKQKWREEAGRNPATPATAFDLRGSVGSVLGAQSFSRPQAASATTESERQS